MNIQYFSDALAARDARREATTLSIQTLQSEYETALMAAAKRRFPRRRSITDYIKASDALSDAETSEIRLPFQVKVDDLKAARNVAEKDDERRLQLLAEATDIPLHDGEWVLVDQSLASHYGSQGYSAGKYARCILDIALALVLQHGIVGEVKVIARNSGIGSGIGHRDDYGLFVNTTPHGWLVARRKPVQEREWVRLCWKHGVNPRVYDPFLPHDFEEEEGLDYFGGDLRAARETA